MKEINDLIGAICKELSQFEELKFREWVKEENVVSEIQDFQKIVSNIQKGNAVSSSRRNKFYFYYLDIIILKKTHMYCNLEEELRRSDLGETKQVRLRYFASTLAVKINDLLAISKLLKAGLEVQARLVFRHLIELYDISLCFLGDENFFNEYHRGIEFENGELKLVSPSSGRISKIANKVLRNRYQITSDNPISYWKHMFDLKTKLYKDLSVHAHGGFQSLIMRSLVEPLQNNRKGFSSIILGQVSKENVNILEQTLFYSQAADRPILEMIISDFNLPMQKFGLNGEKVAILIKICEPLFKVLSQKMINDAKHEKSQ